MNPKDNWNSKIGGASVVTVIVTVVTLAIVFPERIDDLASWETKINHFLQNGTTIDPNSHLLQMRFWLFLVLLGVVITWVLWLSLWVHAEMRRRREIVKTKELRQQVDTLKIQVRSGSSDADERAQKAEKTLKGMMSAAAAIRDKLTPVYTSPSKSVRSVHMVYLIYKDFTTQVTREYEIIAVKDPLHYWGLSNSPTQDADPVEYLDDIDFKVVETSGMGEVVFLPVVNELREKRVTVYFLPRIEPGSPGRHIRLSFKWPGFNKRLGTLGEEEFATTLSSADPIESIKIEIYIEDHKHLEGKMSGPHYKENKIEKQKHSTLGWDGFIYSAKDIPAGTHRVAITAKLDRP